MSKNHRPVEDIQSTDDGRVDETLSQLEKSYEKRQRHTERAEKDATVRKLLAQARKALAGASDHDLDELLRAAHWLVRDHPELETVLRPDYTDLDPLYKSQFRDHMTARNQGERPPSPRDELEALFHVALELEVVYSVEDATWYEPVRFSKIDPAPGKASTSGDVTPIGRIRIGADEPIGPGDRAPVIEHKSCEHVLTVALPRQGKDSTNVSLCANLKEDHQYKWISLWDDGRDETNMIAIPNDEEPIRENIDEMNQEPRAFDTRVYVPAMSGLPKELPGNFEPFTIGVDDLTGKLILQLGGFDADRNTINRVEQALAEAKQASSDQVAVLVDRLEKYAEEVEATVTIKHLADDDMTSDDLDDDEELVRGEGATEIRYEMDADDVLRECAQTVLHLAGEGLLADADAETNLDMTEIVKRNDRVATLNCNYLEDRNEPLKYIITNLWLRLLLRVRDKDKSLPRVALEVRELKQIAPSKLTIVDYTKEVRPLRQTLYEIATQGGSRRIMMLGSTQKLNDVAKPVRSNMPYKIFLKLDNGLIKTMDDEMQFPYGLKEQLKGFDPGQGALKVDEDFFWPIWWRGAPCGLGDGDVPFERRYGLAYGYRVRSHENDRWRSKFDTDDVDWWVDTDGTAYPTDEPPDVDQWYLLSTDIEDCVRPETLDSESVKRFAERRQEYDVPNDLTFQRTSVAHESREMRIEQIERAKERRMAELMNGGPKTAKTDGGEEIRLPAALRPWLDTSPKKREKYLRCLTEIEQDDFTNRQSIANYAGINESTLGDYLSDENGLDPCVNKKEGVYALTKVGREALQFPWDEVE